MRKLQGKYKTETKNIFRKCLSAFGFSPKFKMILYFNRFYDHTMIRLYKITDKTAVLHLLRLNTPQFFASHEETDLVKYLDSDSDNYYVVERNEEVIGAGGINYFTDKARISWDIIHPAYQGQGIGNELTRFRIEKIKENPQIKEIQVRTTQLSYKFYEKSGFKVVQTKKDFWAKGFDLYDMKLILD